MIGSVWLWLLREGNKIVEYYDYFGFLFGVYLEYNGFIESRRIGVCGG